MKIELDKYKKQNTKKLDAIGAGISIEKHHKEFLEKHNINLSALVRGVIEKLIEENNVKETPKSK